MEMFAQFSVGGQRMYGMLHVPDGPAPAQGWPSVVLVHGFLCNRGFWTPWLPLLRERGHAFVAVDLEPPFGSIDDYAGTIDAARAAGNRAAGSFRCVRLSKRQTFLELALASLLQIRKQNLRSKPRTASQFLSARRDAS